MFVIEAAILGTTLVVISSLRFAKYLVTLDAEELKEATKPPVDKEARKLSFDRRRAILQAQRDLYFIGYNSPEANERTRLDRWKEIERLDSALANLAKEEADP
jgi:hypothetical protein